MNNIVLIMLSLMSILVIYWVLIGQKKHNRMMMEEQIREMVVEKKDLK